ncbi:MAG: c-type cytochrome [Woeseiaceae bacterium]|nr:c-type cytochrome [Woeseiaceae bacterium]
MPNPTAFVLAWSLILAACGAEQGRESPAGVADSAGQSPGPAASATEISGQDAYNMVCAGCHETGKNGAPVTGNPADWEHRSHLWQAVLMEHANAGYLEMPARGGDEALSDWTINAATQYMLEITFPDRPGD